MSGHAGEVFGAQRLTLRTRAAQLWGAVAFLVGRVVFGAGAYLLLLAGLVVGAGVLWVLAFATVFVVPIVAAAFVAVFALAVIARIVSEPVRRWLARQPLRRAAEAIMMIIIRGVAYGAGWWLLRCRALARRERARVAAHLDAEIPITYRPLPEGPLPTLAVIAADPATWRDLLYLIVVPAYAVAACLLSAGMWAGGVGILGDLATDVPASWRDAELWGWAATGTVALVLAPFVTYALASIGMRLGAAMLETGETARMRAELDEQRLRRQLAVDAAEHERRRIERDLHDGAQQRLVALGMTLGLARQKLRTDPDAAAELVEEAHTEAKLAHAELRDLARGIHPAILADRGLDAALSALLRRLPLPVSIIVALPRRPSAAVESAAYFVVSEALTNVSRHAAATRATVSITEAHGNVAIAISDDGVGGADPAGGTGLNGLSERVAALNGKLAVDSPAGGPTTIRAEIPCGL